MLRWTAAYVHVLFGDEYMKIEEGYAGFGFRRYYIWLFGAEFKFRTKPMPNSAAFCSIPLRSSDSFFLPLLLSFSSLNVPIPPLPV